MKIIVTGASKGIGFDVVKEFSRVGENHIFAISRNEQNLKILQNECRQINPKANVTILPMDLSLPQMREKIEAMAKESNVPIDIVINNAGAIVNKPFSQLTEDDFDNIFNVNVKSVFRLIQVLLPYFGDNSHIVNISSMGGYQGSSKFPGLSLYSASKGALAILSECLAEELKENKISVNCLAIGAVQTEMLAEAFPGYNAPILSNEMASYIKDFALNGHKYFNGKVLPVSLSTP